MSHVIYEGLVTKDNLGPEFDQSTAPIKLKTGSGLLKDPVTGVVTVDPAFIAANTPPPVADIFTNAATYNAGQLTIKDNNAGTPDVVVDLGDLKRVAIANTASVVLSGTGETATPLAATVTAIPAGVPIPAAQLTGVVPAANLPATTNVLAVTGPNLVSTVNGVASSVPMASIVPVTTVSTVTTGSGAGKTLTTVVNGVSATTAIGDSDSQALSIAGNVISLTSGGSVTLPAIPATTHFNTWTKATGLKESVNGVASDIAIAAGTIVDVLGYDGAGTAVHQVKSAFVGNVRYGATAPTVLPTDKTNDTYVQTQGGTSAGSVQYEWVFDGTAWKNLEPRVIYNYNATTASVIPAEAQVLNLYDGDFGNPELPVVTQYSEPITIVSNAAFNYTIGTLNRVPGATPIAAVKGVAYTFYPILGVGWVYGGAAGADFWRSSGNTLPDGANDTTETIAHDGRAKIGGGSAPGNTGLTIANTGLSVVSPASGGGLIVSDAASARIYIEHQSAPPAGRVMMLRSENGISTFASVSDTGAAFVVDSILGMTHSNGDLRFGSYPNTRNDSGAPINVLSTDVNGNVKSHLVSEITSLNTVIKETFVSTSGSLTLAAPVLSSTPGLDTWTIPTLIEVIANGTITLPTIPAALAPHLIGVEIDIKAFGSWVGAVTVAAPAGITIDNAATYVFTKVAALQPSISLRYTGSKWLVV